MRRRATGRRMAPSRALLVTAASLGFLGVALGAFGAHGLERTFAEAPRRAALWSTATTYLLVHALATGLAAVVGAGWAGRAFVAGCALFSGSLYALALSQVRALGVVTPLGGLAFLTGWLLLGVHAVRAKAS